MPDLDIERQTLRLTTAQAIVMFLQNQWSEFDKNRQRLIPAAFGLFGHGNVVGLGQALEEFGEGLPFYQAKNEQSAVHQAIGYAKATNRLSTFACLASVGPGSTNMVTGAATATSNRLPVLLFPADTFVRRRQGPVLQQIEDPISAATTVNDAFRPVSRFFDRISHPEQVLYSLPEACRVLTDPAETGAVTLSIHQDVEGEAWDFPSSFFAPRTWRIDRRPPSAEAVEAAVSLMQTSARPFIIAGGGVRYSGAGASVADFASRFGVPVGETFAGKGSVPNGQYHLGGVGVTGTGAANALASRADLVICIGTRLQDFTTGSNSLFQNPHVTFLGINVAGHDAYKLGALPVVADAQLAVNALADRLRGTGWGPVDGYETEIESAARAWNDLMTQHLRRPASQKISQGEIIRALNDHVNNGDAVVAAAGSPPADIHKMWDHSSGSEIHLEFGFSCMGHEIPAAMGYKMARPGSSQVYVVMGEGNWLLGNPEIVSAVQEGIAITVVLITNDGYQSIRDLQERKTGEKFGTELRYRSGDQRRLNGEVLPVDFAANARSLGCDTFVATEIEAFEAALESARSRTGPVVIVCPVEPRRMLPGGDAWWDVGIAEASQRTAMLDISAGHLKERDAQRFYYSGAIEQLP